GDLCQVNHDYGADREVGGNKSAGPFRPALALQLPNEAFRKAGGADHRTRPVRQGSPRDDRRPLSVCEVDDDIRPQPADKLLRLAAQRNLASVARQGDELLTRELLDDAHRLEVVLALE